MPRRAGRFSRPLAPLDQAAALEIVEQADQRRPLDRERGGELLLAHAAAQLADIGKRPPRRVIQSARRRAVSRPTAWRRRRAMRAIHGNRNRCAWWGMQKDRTLKSSIGKGRDRPFASAPAVRQGRGNPFLSGRWSGRAREHGMGQIDRVEPEDHLPEVREPAGYRHSDADIAPRTTRMPGARRCRPRFARIEVEVRNGD